MPIATVPLLQHALDTYSSETAKTRSVWLRFSASDLEFRPHEHSTSVAGVFRHQLLSERRFFAEFLGVPSEPVPSAILPAAENSVAAWADRLTEFAGPRLGFLAMQPEDWWLCEVPFFDVRRQRIWILWRRILHTAHHRTQLTVYLRLLGKPVPSTYGPTHDETWDGADPTLTVEAAGRS